MKAQSKKQLFVEMTPAQAATVNGGATKYWNRGAVTGSNSTSTDAIVFI
jgi:hypothetical protein